MTSLQQALGYSSFCGCLRSRELLGSHGRRIDTGTIAPAVTLKLLQVMVDRAVPPSPAAHARPFLAARWMESFQPEGCVLNAPNLMGSPAFACQYSQVRCQLSAQGGTSWPEVASRNASSLHSVK